MVTAIVLLSACHNDNSSTVAEQDDEYANSFHSHDSTGHEEAPGKEGDHH